MYEMMPWMREATLINITMNMLQRFILFANCKCDPCLWHIARADFAHFDALALSRKDCGT